MTHFSATIKGYKGEASRCGTKSSGMLLHVAGWQGAIQVKLSHDDKTRQDLYTVKLMPWRGNGVERILAEGVLDAKIEQVATMAQVMETMLEGMED